jgi:hypothetical protein
MSETPEARRRIMQMVKGKGSLCGNAKRRRPKPSRLVGSSKCAYDAKLKVHAPRVRRSQIKPVGTTIVGCISLRDSAQNRTDQLPDMLLT